MWVDGDTRGSFVVSLGHVVIGEFETPPRRARKVPAHDKGKYAEFRGLPQAADKMPAIFRHDLYVKQSG